MRQRPARRARLHVQTQIFAIVASRSRLLAWPQLHQPEQWPFVKRRLHVAPSPKLQRLSWRTRNTRRRRDALIASGRRDKDFLKRQEEDVQKRTHVKQKGTSSSEGATCELSSARRLSPEKIHEACQRLQRPTACHDASQIERNASTRGSSTQGATPRSLERKQSNVGRCEGSSSRRSAITPTARSLANAHCESAIGIRAIAAAAGSRHSPAARVWGHPTANVLKSTKSRSKPPSGCCEGTAPRPVRRHSTHELCQPAQKEAASSTPSSARGDCRAWKAVPQQVQALPPRPMDREIEECTFRPKVNTHEHSGILSPNRSVSALKGVLEHCNRMHSLHDKEQAQQAAQQRAHARMDAYHKQTPEGKRVIEPLPFHLGKDRPA